MATRSNTITTNATFDFGMMTNPIFTVDGGTWGGATVKIKMEGVPVDEGYTADFYGKLYDTGGAPMKFSVTVSGGSSHSIPVKAVYAQGRGRAVSA